VEPLSAFSEVADLSDAGLPFVMTVDCFGSPQAIPVKEGGDANLEEYSQLACGLVLTSLSDTGRSF
jgi:hypothetical protein